MWLVLQLRSVSQAAAENETVGSEQLAQPVPTRGNNDGMFSWSNFRKHLGWLKEHKMT